MLIIVKFAPKFLQENTFENDVSKMSDILSSLFALM